MTARPEIITWQLWALVAPANRYGSRYIDWGSIGTTRKAVREAHFLIINDRLAAGWTIEKVELSGGWKP